MDDKSFDKDRKVSPIEELAELTIEEDPEFSGRVKRGLNRTLLMGDTLEFSLDIFQKTLWEYLKSAFEIWPSSKGDKTEQ